ncbi:outer membrane protein assembly factor BamB family protein [Planctomicrobium sp. SH664]|uniref:outer membrane protein assembly factor BamB family protein n=1 Tax=Planctomicrobium sp. SH664 TaxID=3448125 RepID=UPI003F5B1279
MAFLEIMHYTGENERRELSKQTPITIGSHPSNDLCIDEDGVDIMHCRVSWGSTGFEAVAAGVDPIEVNGTPMQRTTLKAGDVLRFGTVDIRYREGEHDGSHAAEVKPARDQGLKPISDEIAKRKKPTGEPDKKRSSARPERDVEVPNLDSLTAALDALAAESLAEIPVTPKSRTPKSPVNPPKPVRPVAEPTPPAARAPSPVSASPAVAPTPKVTAPVARPAPAEMDAMSDRMRQVMRARQVRPGEEDPLRSPLVLGLAGGAVVLALTGLIVYFLGTRQSTQQAFDAAKSLYDEGKYAAGIESLQSFITNHPKDGLATDARHLLGSARVKQQIQSATPKYSEGLTELRKFIDSEKDRNGFESLHQEFVDHARTISLGAAVAAGKQFDPNLLQIADQARTILKNYAPKATPPTETLEKIERSMRTSEAAILKEGVFKEQLAAIDAALARNDPLAALKARRDLLIRYPPFESDRKVVAATQKTLAAEKDRVLQKDLDQKALTTDHDWPKSLLTLASQSRTRQDEVASGRAVIVVAQDCVFGIEMVTGLPLWRREIGFDTPFFPMTEETHPSVFLFDTRHQELVRLHQNTGALLWRQPLGTNVIGQPLLTRDAIYVATADRRLLAVDVASGEILNELLFSQTVSGPVELSDKSRIVVAGNEEVLYTLTRRPFACETVTYLGQPPASVQAPLLSASNYLLLIQNGTDQATLRLLTVEDPAKPLTEAASARVNGRVIDPAVLRGRDLFVPSSGERVSAFSLSADPGQPPLTTGPVYRGEGKHSGPVFLLTGPDRQLWMATGALARLQLSTDSLQLDGNPVAQGVATQPLQFISGYLFNARRRPYTQAVTFTRTDRDELTSDWQAVVGGRILAWVCKPTGPLNIAAVNSAGQAFRITDRQFGESKFITEPTERLPLHADLVDPLLAATIPGERLAIACGNPEPRVWILNAAGKIEASPQLPGPPQAAPSSIGNFIVVPLPGRLHVVRQSGQAAVQDYLQPTGEPRVWLSVLPVDKSNSLAFTKDGLILQLRLNESPRPNLAEGARVELGQSLQRLPAAAEGLLAVVDSTQQVSVFATDHLEPRGKRQFDAPVSNRLWIAAGKIFVEVDGTTLHALDPQRDLESAWTLPLDRFPVAGIELIDDQLLIARQDGMVLTVHPGTGEVLTSFDTRSPLSLGPLKTGGKIFVATTDGTLIALP